MRFLVAIFFTFVSLASVDVRADEISKMYLDRVQAFLNVHPRPSKTPSSELDVVRAWIRVSNVKTMVALHDLGDLSAKLITALHKEVDAPTRAYFPDDPIVMSLYRLVVMHNYVARAKLSNRSSSGIYEEVASAVISAGKPLAQAIEDKYNSGPRIYVEPKPSKW